MRQSLFFVLSLSAAMLVIGCATKTYVRQTVQPVQAKVDQVADQANKQGAQLDQVRKDVDKNTTAIEATDEKAATADQRAGEALTKANQVGQKSDQEISALRQVVANLDNYKVVNQTTVLFGFNRAALTAEAKQQLDQLVGNTETLKHYFIAVAGYTDQTGPASYNLDLSRRRAEAVVQYLLGQRDVDFNRIHVIGLGEQKPADTGSSREARSRNRRVEVQIYSADAALAGLASSR
jgi:OOP family OmpA-OmpF porin